MSRARSVRTVACCLLLVSMAPVAVAQQKHVSWSRLGFRISKLMLTVRVEVEARTVPASSLREGWIRSPEGLAVRPRGREILAVRIDTQGAGRGSVLDLWADPLDGAALQRVSVERGRQPRDFRFRGYRFTDRGVFSQTRHPRSGEVGRPTAEWSDVEEEFLASPREQWGRSVDAAALFWIVSTLNPTDPDDGARLRVWLRRGLFEVSLEPRELTQVKVDYDEEAEGGAPRRVRGVMPVRRYVLHAVPLATNGSQRAFRFAGLSGDIDVYVDVQTRVPVQVSGSLRPLGRGHLKLRTAKLR